MKVLGIDAAFRNVGLVEATYQNKILVPHNLGIIKTTAHREKTRSLDDYEEAQKIAKLLRPFIARSDIVVFELPYGSQNSRAGKLLGVTTGIMASIWPLAIPVSPLDVKKTVKENATKKEMVAWATDKYSYLNWDEFNKGDWEHLADAIGVLHAFFKTT